MMKKEQIKPNTGDNSTNPLVSIVVITYNSANFILETLESAKAQSYANIELIITDDCSTDNTLEICKEWLVRNNTRFVQTALITSDKNTGIAANCNRGFTAAKGEWIKGIAGDDILFKDCVLDSIQYITEHREVNIFQSLAKIYIDTFDEIHFQRISSNLNHPFSFASSEQQFKLLQYQSYPIAPAIFMKRSFFINMGKYDESLPLEDWPFWLKITKRNEKIYQLDKVTVGYRIHNKSAFNQKKESTIFSKYYLTDRAVHKKFVFGNCSKSTKFFIDYKHYTRLYFDKLGLNNNSFFLCKALFYVLNKPYSYHLKYLLSRIKTERMTS
ncbi:glycosyltransferase [Maribacter luteus]|uniref:Glycosyltransferase n=1 Tax=Maribacter luteus TaxID=2594478 RepID=A0A6I2MNE7_9FLAO|nr:glycosyltransferase [Maribacter luteus]MRX63754.1 glycosyltransferase [Maribacter luteus]